MCVCVGLFGVPEFRQPGAHGHQPVTAAAPVRASPLSATSDATLLHAPLSLPTRADPAVAYDPLPGPRRGLAVPSLARRAPRLSSLCMTKKTRVHCMEDKIMKINVPAPEAFVHKLTIECRFRFR